MIRVGVIGSGFGVYGLLPAFGGAAGCRVVAYAGKNTDRSAAACKRYGVLRAYSDWRELLASEQLDALAIAVTPGAQRTIVRAAVARGLHVFAEKPLANSLEDANELVALVEMAGVVNAVDFLFPKIPTWRAAKSMIDERALGDVEHVGVKWTFMAYDIMHAIRSWKTSPTEGGGALSFFFCHTMYYLEHMFGEIRDLRSVVRYSSASLNGGDVGADLLLRFAGGAGGMVEVCCDSVLPRNHEVRVDCTEGTIVLANRSDVVSGFSLKRYDRDGECHDVTCEELSAISEEDERVPVVRVMAEQFVQACTDRKEMRPNFTDGARAQELVKRAMASCLE